MAYDLVIRNGTVIDGSGRPGYAADIGVQGGKIVAVGKLNGTRGRTLDAEGLVVSPGFFDMHTHYDVQLAWDPLATPSCWHGVTTVLTGNCGYTVAPGRTSDSEYLMRLMAHVEGIPYEVIRHGLDWQWETFGDYLRHIGRSLGVNVAAQVGHSALRYYVMGSESYERAATDDELTDMKEALREGMAAGAIGFSSLQSTHQTGAYGKPVPSQLATPEELMGLCEVLSEFGHGIIGMNPKPGPGHISPEFGDLLITISRNTGMPILWNSVMHRWDKPELWRAMLRYMDRAEAEGAQIYAIAKYQRLDIEFNLRSTAMLDRLPAWKDVMARPHDEKKVLLADDETRARLRQQWADAPSGVGLQPDRVQVERSRLPDFAHAQGKRITELGSQAGKDPVDYLLDLALAEDLGTQFSFTAMNGDPEAVGEMIKDPHCLPGVSDAGAHLDHECGVDFTGLLLGHWVGEKGVMTLEEAVRRLTSMSAGLLGITDRGLLQEGKAADIVIFDPSTIRALPKEVASDLPGGGQRIIQRAEGVKSVMVNGQVLIEDGKHTGALTGKVLSPTNGRS